MSPSTDHWSLAHRSDSHQNDIAAPTRYTFLGAEFIFPEPSTLFIVAVAGGPQTSNPKLSNIGQAGPVERAPSDNRPTIRPAEENPEWRHVAESARQHRQQQENIRRRYYARVDTHFVRINRSNRYQKSPSQTTRHCSHTSAAKIAQIRPLLRKIKINLTKYNTSKYLRGACAR